MEMLLDFLFENIVYILASVGTIIAIICGKPKTVVQLEMLKNNKVKKLVKRGMKLEEKLQKTSNELCKLTESEEKFQKTSNELCELTEKKEGD